MLTLDSLFICGDGAAEGLRKGLPRLVLAVKFLTRPDVVISASREQDLRCGVLAGSWYLIEGLPCSIATLTLFMHARTFEFFLLSILAQHGKSLHGLLMRGLCRLDGFGGWAVGLGCPSNPMVAEPLLGDAGHNQACRSETAEMKVAEGFHRCTTFSVYLLAT